MSSSLLRLVWIYPDLLSTYGDRGNLLTLAHRAESRRVLTESVTIRSDQHVPREADIYLVGGGEDGAQALAARKLIIDGGLAAVQDAGKVVFTVCAGYQICGESFVASGERHAGLGLFDARSERRNERAVGELSAEVDCGLPLPTLTGFENHGGLTHLGPVATPVARVTHGVGNDGHTEGAWQQKTLGTYMHGPVLARNPAMADLLIAWATGHHTTQLAELDASWTKQLRQERLTSVAAAQQEQAKTEQ